MNIKNKLAQIGVLKLFTVMVICMMSFSIVFVMASDIIFTNSENLDDNYFVSYGVDSYDYHLNTSNCNFMIKANSNWGDGAKYCVFDQGSEYCVTYQAQDMSYRNQDGGQDYISSVQNSIAVIDENVLTYPEIFPNVDLIYVGRNTNLKELYVLSELPSSPASYLGDNITLDFGGYIKYGGLDIYVDGILQTGNSFITANRIEFRNGYKTMFYLPEPIAYDSNGTSTNLQYEVKISGNQIWFYVRTPYSFLENAVYPVVIDPTFTTASVDSVDVTALDECTIVVSWSDSTLVDRVFAVYDTNGTALTSVITVDDTYRYGFQNGISVSALNSTNFVIAYADSGSDVNAAVYDREGNVVLSPVTVDGRASEKIAVSVSAFNSTHFVVGFFDDDENDATFSIYDIAGTLIAGPIDVDDDVGVSEVSVSAFNSTDFVIAYADSADDIVAYAIYNIAGTLLSGPTDIDTATYNGRPASVATLSSTQFVVAWYDSQYPDDDVKYAVYDYDGTEIVAPTVIDESTANIYSVSVSALNSTHFVVSWNDADEGDATFAIYNTTGTEITSPTDSSTTALQWEDVASYQAGTDIGICNNNFIHAFVTNTTSASWTAYYPNGTVWDGVCIEAPSNTAPTIGNPTLNTYTPTTEVTLTCTNGSFTDTDGDSATWYYRWYDSGALISGQTSTTLDLTTAGLDKADTIICSTIASDGTVNATAWTNSSTATIQNSIPTVPTTDGLTPNGPVITDTLTGSCSGSTDLDSDAITYHYQFYDITDTNVRQAFSTDNTYALVSPGDAHDQFRVDCRATTASGNSATDRTGTDLETVADTLPTTPTGSSLTATVKVGETLTGTGAGSTDADGDSVTYEYQFWNVDDAGEVQARSSDNTYVIQATDAHNTIRVRIYGETTYGGSASYEEETKAVSDTIPTTPTDLSLTATVKVTETLTGTCTDSTDADGDAITYFYEFYNVDNTATRQAFSTDNTYVIQVADAHDVMRVRCLATTTLANSSTYDTENKLVADTLPTNPSGSSLTATVKVGETLTGTGTGSTDADTDAITYNYEFYNTNSTTTLQAYSTDNTYVIQVSDAHDLIRVRIKATTALGNSTSYEELNKSVTDTLPSVPATDGLAPNSPVITDTLTGTCSGSTDADGDSITYHYRFYDITDANERQAFSTDDTYPLSSPTDSHDQFRVDCRAVTSLGNSATDRTGTDLETVQNTIPTVTAPALNSTTPKTNDIISCDGGTFGDIDGDSESSREFRWYDSDVLIAGQTSQTLALATSGLDKADTLKCEIRVNDGTGYSVYINSSNTATIQNTIPTNPSSFSLTAGLTYVGDTLTGTASGSTDADSDAITYFYEFYNTISTTTVQAYSSDSTYVIQVSDAHDSIRVRVLATTSDANSSTHEELTRSISNTAPIISNNQVTVNKDSDVLYSYDYEFTDADGDSMTWSDDTALFNIVGATGVISDTPTESETGTHSILITANDGNGRTDTDSFDYIVADATNPLVVFDNQNPADIDSTNGFSTGFNISYDVSDFNLNVSTVNLFYKINSSTSDETGVIINGSALFSGGGFNNFFTDKSNVSNEWVFGISDNSVYPATYNFNEVTMESTAHSIYEIDSPNDYIKIELLNVSNTTQYNMFEVMANTSGTRGLRAYYCNSSYTTGNPVLSDNCNNFYNLDASSTFSHDHTEYSKHQILPMAIDTVTGMVGDVKVTPTSQFLIRGRNQANKWGVYYITDVSRADAIQTTANKGSSWTNLVGTVDAHIHQFDGSETFYYYACANDTSNNQNCTDVRTDLLDLAGLPPNAPNVYNPTESTYTNIITINYTASLSPNGYAISFYNITLVDENLVFVKTIQSNNSLDLSYVWNSSGTVDGTYYIRVEVTDNLTQSSFGYSENFTKDTTAPLINWVEPISAVTLNGGTKKTVNVLFNASDVSGINISSANLSLYKAGETTRYASTCNNDTYSNQLNCTVSMEFYDGDGIWNINASIKDNWGYIETNITQTFTVNTLDYITQDVTTTTWSTIYPNTNDNEAGNTITMTNGGNQNYGSIDVTAYNSTGGVYANVITAESFSIDGLTAQTTGQVYMVDSVATDVTSVLSFSSHGADVTEEIFFYIDLNGGLFADTYTSDTNWGIKCST